MPIPDFQTLMRPLLAAHEDGKEHIHRELVSQLADQFELSEDERLEMLPNGGARLFDNRVRWASMHISQAGLLTSPRRAVSVITDRGRTVLMDHPDRVNLRDFDTLEESLESTDQNVRRLGSIPQTIIELIELGARPDLDQPDTVNNYADLRAKDWINRCHWSEWKAIMAPLSLQELECLIKGLTVSELRFGWSGGSVSSVIWVFKEIQRRSPPVADRVYEWVIRRSTNPYAPTGRSRNSTIPRNMIPVLDQMTAEDRECWFLSFQDSQSKCSEQRHKEKVARLKKTEQEAQNNRKAAAQRKALKQEMCSERRAAREALIQAGAVIDDVSRLWLLIKNPEMPLDAVPVEWADIPNDSCVRMTDAEIESVMIRIAYKRKGPWKRLFTRLAGIRQTRPQR